jgi:hypothetical protein
MERFGENEFPFMKDKVTEKFNTFIFLSNLHPTTEQNIKAIFADLGLSNIFITSSKRFEYLCSVSGFLACYSLDLQ